MKSRIIFSMLLLVIGASAFSQDKEDLKITRKKIEVASFDRIRVEADINVVLYEDSGNTVAIEGQEATADDVIITVKKGELVVSTRVQRDYKKKAIVNIPVKHLRKLEVNADAMVVSMNVLQSEVMDLSVNSECWMSLKLTGRINVLKGDAWGTISYKYPAREVALAE
jgi:hypothetical protein